MHACFVARWIDVVLIDGRSVRTLAVLRKCDSGSRGNSFSKVTLYPAGIHSLACFLLIVFMSWFLCCLEVVSARREEKKKKNTITRCRIEAVVDWDWCALCLDFRVFPTGRSGSRGSCGRKRSSSASVGFPPAFLLATRHHNARALLTSLGSRCPPLHCKCSPWFELLALTNRGPLTRMLEREATWSFRGNGNQKPVKENKETRREK